MLYETFNSLKEAHGENYFTSRISDEIVHNLNPKFELSEIILQNLWEQLCLKLECCNRFLKIRRSNRH